MNNKNFFKLYSDNVKKFSKISKKTLLIFFHFCSVMSYDTGCFILTKDLRKHIASSYGIEMKTFYNIIGVLKKNGYIRTNDDVYYFVNQDIASKGRS